MAPSCTGCSGKGSNSCGVCPFSIFLFGLSVFGYMSYVQSLTKEEKEEKESEESSSENFEVIFILGGPGSGKGTQCEKLTKKYPHYTHLSAGDLLRAERKKSDSELSKIINSHIAEGKLVPSEITVELLYNAMKEAYDKDKTKHFLIDGFPRNQGNVDAWNGMSKMKTTIKFVLFFDCSEEIMTSRLIQRGKTSGRNDDELDVIRKRFLTYRNESMPIIEMYEKEGLLKTISADKSVDDVFGQVCSLFD